MRGRGAERGEKNIKGNIIESEQKTKETKKGINSSSCQEPRRDART